MKNLSVALKMLSLTLVSRGFCFFFCLGGKTKHSSKLGVVFFDFQKLTAFSKIPYDKFSNGMCFIEMMQSLKIVIFHSNSKKLYFEAKLTTFTPPQLKMILKSSLM